MTICGINTNDRNVKIAGMIGGAVAIGHAGKTLYDHNKVQKTAQAMFNAAPTQQAKDAVLIPTLTLGQKVTIVAELVGGIALFAHGLKSKS